MSYYICQSKVLLSPCHKTYCLFYGLKEFEKKLCFLLSPVTFMDMEHPGLFADEQNFLEGEHSSIVSCRQNKLLRLLSFWVTAQRRKDKDFVYFSSAWLATMKYLNFCMDYFHSLLLTQKHWGLCPHKQPCFLPRSWDSCQSLVGQKYLCLHLPCAQGVVHFQGPTGNQYQRPTDVYGQLEMYGPPLPCVSFCQHVHPQLPLLFPSHCTPLFLEKSHLASQLFFFRPLHTLTSLQESSAAPSHAEH